MARTRGAEADPIEPVIDEGADGEIEEGDDAAEVDEAAETEGDGEGGDGGDDEEEGPEAEDDVGEPPAPRRSGGGSEERRSTRRRAQEAMRWYAEICIGI